LARFEGPQPETAERGKVLGEGAASPPPHQLEGLGSAVSSPVGSGTESKFCCILGIQDGFSGYILKCILIFEREQQVLIDYTQ